MPLFSVFLFCLVIGLTVYWFVPRTKDEWEEEQLRADTWEENPEPEPKWRIRIDSPMEGHYTYSIDAADIWLSDDLWPYHCWKHKRGPIGDFANAEAAKQAAERSIISMSKERTRRDAEAHEIWVYEDDLEDAE